MRQRRLFSWAVLTGTAVLILIIFTDALPWLRGPVPDSSIWHWPYELRPLARWWCAFAAGIFFLAVLGWWLRQKNSTRGQTAVALLLLFVSCVGLQWGLLYADREKPMAELVDRTLAVQTNGYFWTAANITEIGPTLQNYPSAMTQFESDHARTHPPGLVLLNWFTLQLLPYSPTLAQRLAQAVYPLRCTDLWLLEQPAATAASLGVWAVLPLLLGAAAIFPAYGLAKTLSTRGDKAKTAVLVAAVPALLLFAPLPDQLFALLTLLIVWCYVHGWHKQTPGWLLTAGLLLSLATFFSVGNAALLVVLAAYSLLTLWQQPLPVTQLLKLLTPFVLGLSAVWLIYWLGWGVPPWAIVQAGLAEHYGLVTTQRRYGTWFIFNLLDLTIFTGVPIVAVFTAALTMAIQRLGRKSLTRSQLLAISTAVLILLLNLSGSTRGEVGRIWLFFMPLLVVSGGLWLAEWSTNWRIQWCWAGLQVLWAIALGLSWRPMGATIVVAQQPDYPAVPTDSTATDFLFGAKIALTQVKLEPTANALDLILVWQIDGPTTRPYTVFNHLIDEQGNLVAQADGWSVNGQWPPTCWQANESVVDEYEIVLPADLAAGNYTIHTGLYDARDGTRLLTTEGKDHVVTAEITLPTP